MRKRILIVAALAVFAGTAGYGVRTAYNSTTKKQRAGYTIVWQITQRMPDGTSIPLATETRYVSASGKWHAIKNTGDRTEETYAEVGKGVFRKGREKLHFISEYPARPLQTEEELMESPDFLRVDNVLGYRAIVVGSGNRPRTGSEFYIVPALGGENIKIVLADAEPGPRIVFEPVSLIWAEPAASAVAMPNSPINYDAKEKRPGG